MRDQRLQQLFLDFRERGDVRALGELFDGLSAELTRVARHVASDAAEAEDLVQATFLVALEHPERYDSSRPLTAWFVGVLTKEALSWRRQAARKPDEARVLEPRHEREEQERPELHASHEESSGLLVSALRRLPERYRAVLEPHLRAGKSPAEIAREQGTSPVTVRVQLHRGLAQLRQLLPAGMAGGLALSLSERGHAAVRAELVSHAQSLAPTSTVVAGGTALTTTQLGALLMSHRIGLGALGLLILLAGAYVLRTANPFSPGGSAAGVTPELSQPGTPRVVRVSSDDPARSDLSIESPGARSANQGQSLGRLRVTTIWSDGTPAAGIGFQYTDFAPGAEVRSARTDEQGLVTLEGLAPGQYALYGDRGGHANATVLDVRFGDDLTTEARVALEELGLAKATLRLDPGVDVSGRVLDAEGRGVAGASIWITTGLTRRSGIVITHSAADGSFLARQLTSGCLLGARAEGHAPSPPQHVQYWMERSEEGSAIELDLALGGRDATLGGVVVDPAGRPVAGARVRLGAQDQFDTFGPTGAEGPPPPVEVVTDARGEFSARGLEPGQVEYACQAEGFPVRTGAMQVEAGGHGRVEVRLEPAAWLRGTVLSSAGTPVERVGVNAYERALAYPATPSSFRAPRTFTDAEGRFVLGPLASGKVRVSAATSDRKQQASTELEVIGGATYEWNHTLEGLPTIDGVALDVGGAPLDGWTVVAKAMGPLGPPPVATHTGADGSFELTLASRGDCRLELYAPEASEHAERRWVASRAPRTWVEDIPTGQRDLRLVLNPEQEPSATLVGELLPRPGEVTPVVLVTVHHERFHEVARFELAEGAGRLEARQLPAGTLALKLEPRGHAPLWRRDLELTQGQLLDLGELELQLGGDLRVELSRDGGGALEHLDVELRDAQGASWYLRKDGGTLERADLPPGQYTLRVHAEGCGPHISQLTILPGEATAHQVHLASGGSIGFALVDAEERPLNVGASLRVSSVQGDVVFDEALEVHEQGGVGRWLFAPHGVLRVVAEARDGRRVEVSVEFRPGDSTDSPRILRVE